MPTRPLSRRCFLRGAGVALSLPLLDAMTPAFARGKTPGANAPGSPKRMVAIQTNMGILPQHFFPDPKKADAGPAYLDILKAFRARMTVFGGVSHPAVDGAHEAEKSFLSAAPHPGGAGFRNTISLDQLAADLIGPVTRFPSFVLGVATEGSQGMSISRSGVTVPCERSPAALYRRLFVQGKPQEVEARVADLGRGRSALDFVSESAKQLERKVGPADRARIDQYFTAVRDLERQLQLGQEWERKPKPKAPEPAPDEDAAKRVIDKFRLMLQVVRLGLQTDSTRVVSLFVNATEIHPITHHGGRKEALDELFAYESAEFRALADFLTGLDGVKEGGESLLDRTMVLYGTPMGSANSHSNLNLPVLLAGGGFRHAGLLDFDRKKNYPLPNLYVSMLQNLGLAVDRFGSSTGTIRGLERA